MKKLILILMCLIFASGPAFAGFGVQEDGVGEGEAGIVNCSTDIDCAVSDNKVSVTLESALDPATIGATTPGTGVFTQVQVTTTSPTPPTGSQQYTRISGLYLGLYTSSATQRPASGAPAGSVVAVTTANNLGDCGAAGGGTTYVVCSSDGTNWRTLSFKTA